MGKSGKKIMKLLIKKKLIKKAGKNIKLIKHIELKKFLELDLKLQYYKKKYIHLH